MSQQHDRTHYARLLQALDFHVEPEHDNLGVDDEPELPFDDDEPIELVDASTDGGDRQDLTRLPLWAWAGGPKAVERREAEILAAVRAVAEEVLSPQDLERHAGAFSGGLAAAAALSEMLAAEIDSHTQSGLLSASLLAAAAMHANWRTGRVAATVACMATALRQSYGDTLEGRTAARGAEIWMRAAGAPEDLYRWLEVEPSTRPADGLLERLAARMVADAAGETAPLLRDGRVLVLKAPGADWVRPIADAAAASAERNAVHDTDPMIRAPYRKLVTMTRDGKTTTAKSRSRLPEAELVGGTLAGGGALLGVSHALRLLPGALIRASDRRVEIPMPTPEQVARAIEARYGRMPTVAIAPAVCAALTAADIMAACRAGEDGDAVIRRLQDLAERRTEVPRGPTLDGLHGMDDARDWGLALARDLDLYRQGAIGWESVDPGCLLVGPPGTGKSRFAARLAAHCRVPLITASYAEWQSAGDGHLGTFLAAMRATFASAAAAAPCILFVDEIEGFGDRSKMANNHAQYSIAVIDALLELLAGVDDRPGIVVVGATNHADRLDPALRRSGRLDRTIEVPLPDVTALAGILGGMLADDLPGADLSIAADLAEGGTGADCERWVRGARRRARNEKRAVTLADVEGEIAAADAERPMTAEELHVAAVHEAGHALIALLADPPIAVYGVSIGRRGNVGGLTSTDSTPTGVWTRARWLAQVRVALGGRAAEQVMLGAVSAGSGGPPGSDLHMATALVVTMETTTGLGVQGHLTWRDLPDRAIGGFLASNPDLDGRVEAVLTDAYAEAVRVITAHRALLGIVVERLIEKRKLDRAALLALVLQYQQQHGRVRTPRLTGDRP